MTGLEARAPVPTTRMQRIEAALAPDAEPTAGAGLALPAARAPSTAAAPHFDVEALNTINEAPRRTRAKSRNVYENER
jgi:hypothetical protein